MKIRIPSETVEIDVDAWATEFGLDTSDVRRDVLAYFVGRHQEQVEYLGLQAKEDA